MKSQYSRDVEGPAEIVRSRRITLRCENAPHGHLRACASTESRPGDVVRVYVYSNEPNSLGAGARPRAWFRPRVPRKAIETTGTLARYIDMGVAALDG